MKYFFIIFFIFGYSTTFAETTIFGLELGKTTENEIKEKYRVSSLGINRWNGGNMYSVPIQSISFEGLSKVQAIFNKDKKLVGVLTTFPKDKFTYLNKLLGEKYTLIESQIPFVGNKRVKYQDGLTEISIEAPHMCFQLNMNYIHKELLNAYLNGKEDLISKQESIEKSQI